VTHKHFKLNLIQSESRRKQLEVQEIQLIGSRWKAEAAREKVNAPTGKIRLFASMSHELRTPLNAVINFTRL